MSKAQDIYASMPLVYTAQSKLDFYCRDAVCEFVLLKGAVPLNPFRLFDYFLGDRVDRDLIRRANNSVVVRADEVWIFGQEIANGVLLEIAHAHVNDTPLKYFTIATRASEIKPLNATKLRFEPELLLAAGGDEAALRAVVRGERSFESVIK